MKTFNIDYDTIPEFISHIQQYGKVFAPHSAGDSSVIFDEVSDYSQVILDYRRTLLSIKKYFLPPREELLEFSLSDNTFKKPVFDKSNKIFLGVHSYDMQAVLKLDFNFSQGQPENNYLQRRYNSIFIGVSYEPDQYHFGRSVGIRAEEMDGFDLFLNRHDQGYTLSVLTTEGEKLIHQFKKLSSPLSIPPIAREFETQIEENYQSLPDIMSHSWNSPIWEEVAKKCVGCGTCNLVCPTCYCFNIEDELELSLESGTRNRDWDACMLKSFAAVAGGENFRSKLSDRQRHRVHRKFKYISDITGEPWCVGCGRCTAYCTAGISIVDIVNQLSDEYHLKHGLNRQSITVESEI